MDLIIDCIDKDEIKFKLTIDNLSEIVEKVKIFDYEPSQILLTSEDVKSIDPARFVGYKEPNSGYEVTKIYGVPVVITDNVEKSQIYLTSKRERSIWITIG